MLEKKSADARSIYFRIEDQYGTEILEDWVDNYPGTDTDDTDEIIKAILQNVVFIDRDDWEEDDREFWPASIELYRDNELAAVEQIDADTPETSAVETVFTENDEPDEYDCTYAGDQYVESGIEEDSDAWKDAAAEAIENPNEYAEETTIDIDAIVQQKVEEAHEEIKQQVDDVFANLVVNYENAGGSFSNEAESDGLIDCIEDEYGIDDDTLYEGLNDRFDRFLRLKEAVKIKRLKESDEFDPKSALRFTDAKDWDRAFTVYSDKQALSMLDKIADPRKKIGRAAALYVASIVGLYFDEVRDRCKELLEESNVYDSSLGDSLYGSDEEKIAYLEKVLPFVKGDTAAKYINSRLAKLKAKVESSQAEEMQKQADEEARKAKEESIQKQLEEQYRSSGDPILAIDTEWNTFAGHIGAYSLVAASASGKPLSEAQISSKIYDLDKTGKCFCVYELSDGEQKFSTDVANAFSRWVLANDGGSFDVYKLLRPVEENA